MAAGRTRGACPRRVSLPGVAELFRPAVPGPYGEVGRPASGRDPHPHKITMYLPAGKLADLERARPALRGYGVTVDRGRLVREVIAVLLADLALTGADSLVARRPREAAGPEPADGP